MYEKIVFCDFDGTITEEETFVGALFRICEKSDLEYWFNKIKSKQISLGECMINLFQTVPSDRFDRIIEYSESVNVRNGFGGFLDYLHQMCIPIVVISGGISYMQDIILRPYMHRISARYACELDISGPKMRFISNYADEKENMNKLAVMALYEYKQCICIGDNITDIRMSEKADILFARDKLAEHCITVNKQYYEWNDFDDITARLTKLIK